MRGKDLGLIGLTHLGIAILWLWPSAIQPNSTIPGAERTDLWDTLWSLWYVQQGFLHGKLPLHADGLLNHPDGGLLWPADPLNGLLIFPLLSLMTLPAAWTLLVHAHQVFSGITAYGLCRAVTGNRYTSALGSIIYTWSPVALCHIHNGASEAIGMGWLAAAAWATWNITDTGWRQSIYAGILLGICAIGHWYAGVCGFLLGGLLLLSRAQHRPTATRMIAALALGVLIAAPVAGLSRWASTTKGNLVGIKAEKELRAVRRTIGPADPVAYLMPGDYRSPDFRELSRYSEQFIHSPYLGWTAILLSLAAIQRSKDRRIWWISLAVGLLLALGPVLARFGEPVILPGRRAIPLPYLAIEKLPGFSSLSLLWRLSQLGVLSLAVLASLGLNDRKHERILTLIFSLCFLAEIRFFSPLAGFPGHSNPSVADPILALRDAPDGAVINFPVAGGRAYLYEQTVHHKALAGSLNFPNNKASMRVWSTIMAHINDSPEDLHTVVAQAAQSADLRYLVVHIDPMARPDIHDTAVRALKSAYQPIAQSADIRIYQLW